MADVNFYLDNVNEKTKTANIRLRYKFNGRTLNFSTGQTVALKDWSAKKQRVKSKTLTTKDGKYNLNDLLTNLRKECTTAYNSMIETGIPTPAMIKEKLQAFIDKHHHAEIVEQSRTTFLNLLERFITGEIKHKGRDKAPNTIKTYNTLKGHLIAFQKKNKALYPDGLDFKNIDLDFYYKYTSFLKRKGLGVNAVSKDIQILKVIMREAIDLELTDNARFMNKKFAVNRIETDAVYLADKDILTLYNYDLTNNKRLEQVRDLFVFGCHVGLRFSDYSTVQPENIVQIDGEYYIKLITKKTNDLVIIPCNPIVLQIFKKYENNPNRLPKTISNQKFNDYIKEACKAAGLTETGRLSTNPKAELWECISSHTARRSFATNLYLDGFPTLDLMKITGHKTEKAFLKYIRIGKLDTAKRLNEHIKKNWSAKILKVAS
ncbi:MAG: site-specific integrase [Chitinophagaceae bacterium]|nr:site-specific integrase [Chitinophagaceae bacterium]